MSDVESLLAAFAAGELLRPSAAVPNVVDLGNAVAGLAGADGAAAAPKLTPIADLIGPSDHLVFIVADGLGMNVVNAMSKGAFIPRHVSIELRTVFPSSTPVVLTSLATGRWPGRHAVIGWHMYLREVDCVSTIIRFYRRSDEMALSKLGVEPGQTFPVPSLVRDMTRDTLYFLPEDIADTAYSTYASGDTPRRGYQDLQGAIDAMVDRVRQSSGPTFTHLYTHEVDASGHEHGAGHQSVLAAAHRLDTEIERLVRETTAHGARVILSADHGLLDAVDGETHEIGPSDELVQLLNSEPWGDGRATHFDVRPGEEPAFERAFGRRLGSHFYLITVEDAERLELYGPGPISELARSRLGSYIAISKGAGTIWYRYRGAKKEFRMIGHHSGLTPSEMLVPLVVA
jgi:hypothetical protein